MRMLVLAVAAMAFLAPGCHIRHGDDDDFTFWPADFNADGFADIAVGAPLDDDGVAASDRGRVYVHLGSSAPDATADITLSGFEAGSSFGASVAAIGDFNGDGRPDLAVGAPLEDAGGTDRGRVYVYFGGSGFGLPGLTLSGTEDGGQFGASVARAGDVNRDGFEDLLVGAPLEDAGGTDRGRAYLFLGASAPSSAPILTFDGGEDGSEFGASVSGAGDVNGDGSFDWIIGAPGDDVDSNATEDAINRGRVLLYRGSTFLDNSVDLVFSGAEDGGELGRSVTGGSDFNVDGFSDIALGAPLDDGDGNATEDGDDLGRVFVHRGGFAMDSSADLTLTGTETGARFGGLVARAGDVNAGGAPDLLVGAPLDDADGNATENALDRGRAFLYFGGPLMDNAADVTYTGAEDGAEFGTSGDSPGDVDGDGFRDLAIGAPLDDGDGNATENGLDRGRAFWFRGGSPPPSTSSLTLGITEAGANFGESVACILLASRRVT